MRGDSLFSTSSRGKSRVTGLVIFLLALFTVCFCLPVFAVRAEVSQRLVALLEQHMAGAGFAVLGASFFLLFAAFLNHDTLLMHPISRVFSWLVGRSAMRLVFIAGALVGVFAGADLVSAGLHPALPPCGASGT